jgi:hypothetical protein
METSNEIMPVDEFKEIIQAAPTALVLNKEKADKAVAFGKTLLERINTEGMTEELDTECNKYLVKLKNTYQDLFNRRKPLTEMFDVVRKTFTELEGQIDSKSKENVYAQIQKARNDYATKLMMAKKKAEEEAATKLAKDKEVINLKAEIEAAMRNGFLGQLDKSKRNLTACFEAIKLGEFEYGVSVFKNFPLDYTLNTFITIPVNITTRRQFVTNDELNQLIDEGKTGKFDIWAKEYSNSMISLFNELQMKLPAKKQELEAIAKAEAEAAERARIAAMEKNAQKKAELEQQAKAAEEERQRLEAEKIQRQKQEEERQRLEAEETQRKATEQIEANRQVNTTNALFDAEVAVVESAAETNAIESYEIKVLNAPAWLLIAVFYFEREGKKETVEKLEKKSLGQMKKFCESHYKKTSEKIESPYIVYEPIYKVRAAK